MYVCTTVSDTSSTNSQYIHTGESRVWRLSATTADLMLALSASQEPRRSYGRRRLTRNTAWIMTDVFVVDRQATACRLRTTSTGVRGGFFRHTCTIRLGHTGAFRHLGGAAIYPLCFPFLVTDKLRCI